MSELALQLIRQAKAEGWTTLDLGRTGLTELPNELFELEQLETLIISDNYWDFDKKEGVESQNRGKKNKIKFIPRNIGKLVNLKRLNLDGDLHAAWSINNFSFLGLLVNLEWLSLDSNRIKDIQFLRTLGKLRILDIAHNYIEDITILSKLPNLKFIDLNSNRLSDIAVLKVSSKLIDLNLSYNRQIKDFSFLESMSNLTSLHLSDNQIKDISILEKLPNLATLDLGNNQIKDISILEKLPNLTDLYLGNNQIKDISILEKLPNLIRLYLGFNQISDITVLEKLPNLTILDLSRNQIKDISILEKLPNLTTLNLSDNKQIEDFSIIEKLSNLATLDLGNNQIKDISILEKLPNLTDLYLGNNQIKDISILEKLPNLIRLYLWFNQISDITVLEKLPNLTVLNLGNNQIKDISILEKLPNLIRLYLWSNQISDITILEKLPNLITLNFGGNEQIEDFSVLEKLPNLNDLGLNDSQIKDITILEKLPNLISLNLGDNKQIEDFSVLEKLYSLTELYISNNQISDIAFLEKLPNLTKLDFSNNQITDLDVLQRLSFLEEVNAQGTRIKKIPKALLAEENCLPHLYAWWEETADPKNTQSNRTVKLMLTGNSNTGKSTLVHAIKQGKCAEDKQSTDGIQLEQWEYAEDEKAVQFCIWDFGGQEIFHGTHRLFLSAEAIQLILFDPETEQLAEANKPTPNRLRIEEDNRNLPLRYWIDTVQELSPDSKWVVVQNKKDQEPARHANAYKTAAEANLDFRQISAWTGEGIKSLQLALHENAIKLHEYEMPMPKSWLAVQQYFLDNMNQEVPERLLSYAEFERRCREEYGVLELSIPSLLTLLHHNGVVYYNEQYLKDTIIADQRWALDAIYKPLHHESDFYEYMREDWFGKVRVKHIFEAFGSNYKTEEKWLFLNLMRSCALCFPLKEKENQQEENENTRYVFPEFLLPDIPEAVLDKLAFKKKDLQYYRRQYDYLNYYRIQTFIASLGQKTPLKYIWRNGIMIETAEGIFVVEADYENHAIVLRIEANAIHRWLHEIIETIEQQDNFDKVAEFWQASKDGENYTPADLTALRNRAAQQTEREDIAEPEKKTLAEQLPDVAKPLETKKLVVSYAREDRWAIDALKKHLSGLRQSHQIEYWYDQKLDGRDWWNDEIAHEFNTADGYIVFVSPNYIDDEVKRYIHQQEIPTMCRRKNEARIPIYSLTVTSVDYGPTVGQFDFFADKQAIPREEEKQGEFLYRFVEEVIKRKFLQL